MLNRLTGWLLCFQVGYVTLFALLVVVDKVSGGSVFRATAGLRKVLHLQNSLVRLSDYLYYPMKLHGAPESDPDAGLLRDPAAEETDPRPGRRFFQYSQCALPLTVSHRPADRVHSLGGEVIVFRGFRGSAQVASAHEVQSRMFFWATKAGRESIMMQ